MYSDFSLPDAQDMYELRSSISNTHNCVRLKCLQLDKLSVPSRKELFSNLFFGGLMVAKSLC